MLRRYGILTLMAGAGLGVLVGILSGSGRISGQVLEIVVPVACGVSLFIAFAVILAILVHEVGHVVAGLLAGFRFQSMQVGPFELRRQSNGLRLALVENPRLSGLARMVPVSEDGLVPRMLLFILGGPLFSLIYVGISYLWYRMEPAPQRGAGLLTAVPHLAALSLFVMGISVLPGTLLPYTSANGNPTDMRILMTLLGPAALQERLIALVLIGRELQTGIRARNWPASMVERSVALRDGHIEELRARILAYYFFEDAGHTGPARAHLARALELSNTWGKKAGLLRTIAYQEAAIQAAWRDCDPGEAARLLGLGENDSDLLRTSALTAEAVIAWRQGKTIRAAELLDEAAARAEEMHTRFGGSIVYDLERIVAIKEEIKQD